MNGFQLLGCSLPFWAAKDAFSASEATHHLFEIGHETDYRLFNKMMKAIASELGRGPYEKVKASELPVRMQKLLIFS